LAASLLSLSLHAAFLCLVTLLRFAVVETPSLPPQLVRPKHIPLVWYPRQPPTISPDAAQGAKQPKAAAKFESETRTAQIVWRPVDLPQMTTPVPLPNLVQMHTAVPPPPPRRTFVAPATQARLASTAPPEIEQTLSMVVIGAEPAAQLSQIPVGVLKGTIAPPEPGGTGGTGNSGGGGLVAAGLTIRGAGPPASPPPPAVAPASVIPSLRTWTVPPPARIGIAAPLRPSSRSLPAHIEARFQNRVVYSCLFSKLGDPFAGDWTVWFGKVNGQEELAAFIRPPAPRVEAELLLGAHPATVARVSAVIRKDGHLDQIVIMGGLSSEAGRILATGLALWEFIPAMRASSPVDVEALFEIPLPSTLP
jgi:hypothetical protein